MPCGSDPAFSGHSALFPSTVTPVHGRRSSRAASRARASSQTRPRCAHAAGRTRACARASAWPLMAAQRRSFLCMTQACGVLLKILTRSLLRLALAMSTYGIVGTVIYFSWSFSMRTTIMCLQLVLPVLTIVPLFALLITLLALVSRRCSACPQPAARAPASRALGRRPPCGRRRERLAMVGG